jgi:hypothetical protein
LNQTLLSFAQTLPQAEKLSSLSSDANLPRYRHKGPQVQTICSPSRTNFLSFLQKKLPDIYYKIREYIRMKSKIKNYLIMI